MDVPLALSATAALAAGGLLALLAILCRAGHGQIFRSWVRPGAEVRQTGYAYSEVTVLVVLPLLAQTCFAVGLVMALGSVEAMPSAVLGTVIPVVVIGEVLLWCVALIATGYRTIMPLWVYPPWLRSQRRREKERLRSS